MPKLYVQATSQTAFLWDIMRKCCINLVREQIENLGSIQLRFMPAWEQFSDACHSYMFKHLYVIILLNRLKFKGNPTKYQEHFSKLLKLHQAKKYKKTNLIQHIGIILLILTGLKQEKFRFNLLTVKEKALCALQFYVSIWF